MCFLVVNAVQALSGVLLQGDHAVSLGVPWLLLLVDSYVFVPSPCCAVWLLSTAKLGACFNRPIPQAEPNVLIWCANIVVVCCCLLADPLKHLKHPKL